MGCSRDERVVTGPMLAMSVGGQRLALSALSWSSTGTDPGSASATYSLQNDGDIETTNNLGTTDQGDWIANPKANFSGYEVRATETSGTVSTGTVDSWLGLGTTRTWTADQSGLGEKTCAILIEIRGATSLATLASASIVLTATVSL